MSALAAGMTAVIMVAAAVAEAAADPGADAAEIAAVDAASGGRRSAVGRKVKGESVCSPFFTRGRRLIFQLKSLSAVD